MACITSIHLPRSRSAVLQRTCARSFRGRKFLFKSLTVGQAVPEIPLSVGSKLELYTYQSFCLCQMSVYFPVHSRICPRMHIAVYIGVYYISYNTLYMTEAPRVLHFSAFIVTVSTKLQNPRRSLLLYYSACANTIRVYRYMYIHVYTCVTVYIACANNK